VVPEERVAVVRGLLTAVCRPDPVHTRARVVTVYYDTPGFRSLDEKINSDYLKTKIRVRWYERLDGTDPDEAVFVECKYRVGATRHKVRVRLKEQATVVSRWALDRADWHRLLQPLRLQGVDAPPDVEPTLRLAYVRERFVDPVTAARLTLDTDIEVQAVNPLRLRPGLAGRLPGAVVEYKGSSAELPPHLHVLARVGSRKTSYSKYFAAYAHVTREVF
jgi:hypothetical protein